MLKKEDQEKKKGFPFLSVVAFILCLFFFFVWGFFRSSAEDMTRVVNGNFYVWVEETSEWVYTDENGDEWVLVDEPTTNPPTPPPIDDTFPEEETSAAEETTSDSSGDLVAIRSDVEVIRSLLLFVVVVSSAGLFCYMLFRVLRNFF